VTSLEELVRKCLRRRDYDQMIQIIERVPEDRRSESLQTLLEKAREKADFISFLICEIDEADRLGDGRTALKKAEELLTIKPRHHRAREIQEKYSGYGQGGAARIGLASQFTKPWSEGGWIPWSALAFGVAVFAAMCGVIVIYLNGTAIAVDVKDPGVEVAVKGTTLTVTGPDKQSVKVEAGEQLLTITAPGFETTSRSFSLKRGEKKTVTISIVNKEIVARLENDVLPLTPIHGKVANSPNVSKEEVTASQLAKKEPAHAAPGMPAAGSKPTAGMASQTSGLDPERRAAEAVLALGGSVTIRVDRREDEIKPGGSLPSGQIALTRVGLNHRPNLTDAALEPFESVSHLVAVDVDGSPVGDAGLAHLRNQKGLRVLDINGTRVTDAGLVIAEGLPHLVFLSIEQIGITDVGVAHLENLTELEILWVGNGPRITDAGLAHLQKLTNLCRISLWHAPLKGAGLKYLKGLKRLDVLFLGDTDVGDDGLAHLRSLTQLRALALQNTRLTNAGLSHLRALVHLGYLNIDGTKITNAGLVNLETLTELYELGLQRTPVSDSGLAHLTGLTKLTILYLNSTRVTDAGLAHLRSLTALERLELSDTRVSGPGLSNFKAIDKLHELYLDRSRITNSGLEQLKNLPQLQKLHLRGTQVTDAGLHHLEGMTNLDELDLSDTKVTAAGVEKLQKSIPACKILATPKAP
jgi:internalin A